MKKSNLDLGTYHVQSYSGKQNTREATVLSMAGVFLLLGLFCVLFLTSIRFTGWVLIALSAFLAAVLALNRLAVGSPLMRRCRQIFWLLCLLFLLLFVAAESLLFFWGRKPGETSVPDAILVLGAGVNGETPSLVLQERIDTAAEYIRQHPDIPVVLSGGQGPGEDITEAEAMRRELSAQGIHSIDTIYTVEDTVDTVFILENQSTSTAENFSLSKPLLQEQGVDLDTAVIAVITNNFHCFRVQLIARRQNITVVTIPAPMPNSILSINYYMREFFALGKTLVFDR